MAGLGQGTRNGDVREGTGSFWREGSGFGVWYANTSGIVGQERARDAGMALGSKTPFEGFLDRAKVHLAQGTLATRRGGQ